MNRRQFTKNAGLAAGAILASPSFLRAQAKSGKAPNLLYVFPDQMRLHAMEFWKHKGFEGALKSPGQLGLLLRLRKSRVVGPSN